MAKKAFLQSEKKKKLSLMNRIKVIGSVMWLRSRKSHCVVLRCTSGETPSAALLHSASLLFLNKLQSELFLTLFCIFQSQKTPPKIYRQKYFSSFIHLLLPLKKNIKGRLQIIIIYIYIILSVIIIWRGKLSAGTKQWKEEKNFLTFFT